MDKKEENINKVIGLMRNLMFSARIHNPEPWLDLELTREQLRVIFLLSFKGRVTPGEVAESFSVPKANVTSVIERLVSKGLVSRQEDPDDRRRYILSLTEEGRDRVKRLLEIGTAKVKGVLGKMPEEALSSLRIGLESLTTVLDQEGWKNEHH